MIYKSSPPGFFLVREAKWGYMIKIHCHSMAIVKRIFLIGYKTPHEVVIHLI